MIETEAKLVVSPDQDLDNYEAAIRQQVVRAGVARMSEVFYDEAKLNASKLTKTEDRRRRPGHVRIQDAIYRVYSPERSTGAVKTYRVSWNKKKAPHGHLLEFGTAKAPAYPFLTPAYSKVHEAIREGRHRMAEKLAQLRKP